MPDCYDTSGIRLPEQRQHCDSEGSTVIVLVVGIVLMALAPLFRRPGAAPQALGLGALISLSVAIFVLLHVDPRIGEAAIESNRQEGVYIAVCSVLTLIFALLGRRRLTWAFWLGWAIGLAFSLSIAVVVVWFEFFRHW